MSESQYYQEGEHHQDNQEHHHHHHEQQDEHHQHHEHHEHHDQPHHEQTHEHNDVESSGDEKPHETQPSAPSSDENGYVVVSSKPVNSSVVDEISKALLEEKDAAPSAVDVASRTPSAKVVAEADSSTHNIKSVHLTYDPKSRQAGCSMCPYYSLAWSYVNKVNLPPQVRDLIMWQCPKMTGAVFGSILVLLISLMCSSLLAVASSFMLLALVAVGAYRFYLAVMFRIKGTHDDAFNQLAELEISLPKDKMKRLSDLLETDINRWLNQFKAIIFWENITMSAAAFGISYLVYCVGCWLNTLTLLTILHIEVFTLPKIYQVYKQPIDDAIMKLSDSAHMVVRQAMIKFPILKKLKTQ